jgi:hypothetical protein
MAVTVQSSGPASLLRPLSVEDGGWQGLDRMGGEAEDAMINGGQAVDTAGNKNIKTPQSLSPARSP